MTVKEIADKSLSRSNRWHNGDMNNWSALEWAGAMAGEAGEACNAAKKLKRLDDGIPSIDELERNITDREIAKLKIGLEAADTIMYAFCLAARVGVDIEEC